MRHSTESFRDRLPLVLAIFAMLMVSLIISDPIGTIARLLGTAIIVGAIVIAVRRFRRFSDERIPTRWLEHRSATVRFATRAVQAYGVYLVGFYTLIAVLLLFQAIGHFI